MGARSERLRCLALAVAAMWAPGCLDPLVEDPGYQETNAPVPGVPQGNVGPASGMSPTDPRTDDGQPNTPGPTAPQQSATPVAPHASAGNAPDSPTAGNTAPANDPGPSSSSSDNETAAPDAAPPVDGAPDAAPAPDGAPDAALGSVMIQSYASDAGAPDAGTEL